MTLHYTLDLIVSKADEFDVQLPPATRDAYDRLRSVAEQTKGGQPTDHELRTAFIASLVAGNDPLTDPEVTALAARRALGTSSMAAALTQAARQLLHDDAETIFAALAPAFDRAAVLLDRAHAKLGNVRLDGVNLDSPREATARDQAVAAGQAIMDIVNIWTHLAMDGTGFPNPDHRYKVLLFTDPEPKLWFEVRPDLVSSQVSPWDAVCAGLPLSLATSPAVYRSRVEALQTYAEQRAEAEAKAARERRHGRNAGSRVLTLAAAEAASGS